MDKLYAIATSTYGGEERRIVCVCGVAYSKSTCLSRCLALQPFSVQLYFNIDGQILQGRLASCFSLSRSNIIPTLHLLEVSRVAAE